MKYNWFETLSKLTKYHIGLKGYPENGNYCSTSVPNNITHEWIVNNSDNISLNSFDDGTSQTPIKILYVDFTSSEGITYFLQRINIKMPSSHNNDS